MDIDLRGRILNKIKPTPEEDSLRKKLVDEFISSLEISCKKLGLKCDFFIGGSFGKETYLTGSSDVDIFVSFDLKYDDSKISSYLQKILDLANVDYVKQKGSRDYYSYIFKNDKTEIKFELVPNRKIKTISDVLNSTDVSPFHVDFLKKLSLKNSLLFDEIRLAKQFFKAKRLYGAESYINGFSGHIVDILIAYYGSLENLLLDAKSWDEMKFIDINNFYKGFDDAKKKLESDKISKLVVVDPIIKTRNAARALSDENYYKFLLVAQNFDVLREKDFEVIKFDLVKVISGAKKYTKLGNLKAIFYTINFEVGGNSEDIVGSKLLKLNNKIKSYYLAYDFEVFKNEFFIDTKSGVALLVFFFEKKELSKFKKITGPYVYMSDAVRNFTKGRDIYFIEGSRIYGYDLREFLKPETISKIKMEDARDLVGRDVSFIKGIKIMKY
ncbi:MAG: nucleotidyltransferase domain-containing protein [Candidatus Woesearchaeota archaeon]|jgi:tRNA nucleotidyltransferase (CCA-adding enzyme)|nr:nucleotidyltransferase domain-containing protein [Candidatus Woesearchaeota archaeon]